MIITAHAIGGVSSRARARASYRAMAFALVPVFAFTGLLADAAIALADG